LHLQKKGREYEECRKRRETERGKRTKQTAELCRKSAHMYATASAGDRLDFPALSLAWVSQGTKGLLGTAQFAFRSEACVCFSAVMALVPSVERITVAAKVAELLLGGEGGFPTLTFPSPKAE
jgi:hypothetical protein